MSFGFWRLPLKELTDRRLGHIRNLPGANHRGRASWSMVQGKGPGNLAKLSVTQDADGSEQHFPWCPSPKKVSKVLLGCCWWSKIISPGAPEMSHPKNNSNFKYQVKFKKKHCYHYLGNPAIPFHLKVHFTECLQQPWCFSVSGNKLGPQSWWFKVRVFMKPQYNCFWGKLKIFPHLSLPCRAYK